MKKIAVLFLVVTVFALLAHPSLAQLKNGDFEYWIDIQGADPTFWRTSDDYYGGFDAVTKSDDAYQGSFAARLEVLEGPYEPFPAALRSWDDGSGHLVSERYLYVTGYYKLFSESGAQLEILVEMMNVYDLVGTGQLFVDTSSTYRSFHVPIISRLAITSSIGTAGT
jgi:hypothetical protein